MAIQRGKVSRVIYGDSTFIEDMGTLTTLCLLYDEVLLFGDKRLDEHLDEYWATHPDTGDHQPRLVTEQMLEVLLPAGVISFLSPEDAEKQYPGAGDIELGDLAVDLQKKTGVEAEGASVLHMSVKNLEHMKDITRLILAGVTRGPRRVSSVIRDASLLGVAAQSGIPIVGEDRHIAMQSSSTGVPETAGVLSSRILRRLALPEMCAYHVDDILEARLRLEGDLQGFRAGVLDLVWLLHERIDLSQPAERFRAECDVLIETKVAAAALSLERALREHDDRRIRRILRTVGNAFVEFGQSFISPGLPGTLAGASGALMKMADGLELKAPSLQIASFVHRVRAKAF